LRLHQEKFDRKSSKAVYFEFSRCYLESVIEITILTTLKKSNGIKSRLLESHFFN